MFSNSLKQYTLVEYKTNNNYLPYKSYKGQKVRAILTKLGSKAPLPVTNRQVLVINTKNGIKVWLVKEKNSYYFYEMFDKVIAIPKIHKAIVTNNNRLEDNLSRVTIDSVRIALGIKH